MRSSPSAIALLLLGASAAAEPRALWLDAAHSRLGFDLGYSLHAVHGVARALEGRAVVDEARGEALVEVRAPVARFGTGNANRDAHLLEVVEAARFPDVIAKARLPLAGDGAGTVRAQITFHGVARAYDVEIAWVARGDGGRFCATARFEVSLEAHQVKRPSMMFVPVDDALHIAAELCFTAAPDGAAASGSRTP